MKEESNHIDHESLIVRYFENDLNTSEQEELLRLVNNDNEIREIFQAFAIVIRQSNIEKINYKSAYAKFIKKVNPQKSIKTKLYTAISIAAMLIIIIGIGIFYSNTRTNTTDLVANNSIESSLLPDGSTIWLNKNSIIAYANDFGTNRYVELKKGESFFEVKADATHPFVVKAGNAIITVLGTGFDIKIDSTTNNVKVSVSHGKVLVEHKTKKESKILTDSQQIILNNDTNQFGEICEIGTNDLSWQTKRLTFRSTPMSEVVKTLNKYFDSNIQLGNNLMDSCKLNASFDNPELNEILEMLKIVFNAELKQNTSSQILIGSGC